MRHYLMYRECKISEITKSSEKLRGFFMHKKVSEKDAFFFCYAARLLSIFIFKTSLVFSIIPLREVILQK